MTSPRRFASVLSGWLFAVGMAATALGQYQDVDSPDSRMFNSNNRSQSNVSDQGTGYSSSQIGLYGPYYNRTLTNQNNLNNSYNAYELRAARNRGLARVSGLPSRGLPLNSSRLASETNPRRTRRAPPADALGLTLKETDGKLVVQQVREDSPMAHAGFKPGDQIETVNGKVVHSEEEFQLALGNVTVGQEIPIVIVREEQSDTLKWTPKAEELIAIDNEAADIGPPMVDEPGEINFIAAAQLGRGQRGQTFLGVRVDPTKSKEVIVQAVMKGSPAQKAGLRPGDRIYSLSGVPLEAPKELGELLAQNAPGSAVYLYVGRQTAPETNSTDPQGEPGNSAESTLPENVAAPAEAPKPAR